MMSPERQQVEDGEIDLHDAVAKPEQGWLTYVQVKGETFLGLVSTRESPLKLLSVDRRTFNTDIERKLCLTRLESFSVVRCFVMKIHPQGSP